MTWNHDTVIELADGYRALGLEKSSAGRFICSIAQSGEAPRGRGISWLEEIVKQGLPCSLEQRDFLFTAAEAWPTLGLRRVADSLQSTGTLEDWQRGLIDKACEELATGPLELNEPLRQLLLGLQDVYIARGNSYWAGRPAIARRLEIIFKELKKESDRKLLNADYHFLTGAFGPAWREMSKPTFQPGDLCFNMQGEPLMIVSGPTLGHGSPTYVVSDGTQTSPQFSKHLKRRISKARA
jgi:hypothetical protein